MTYYFYYFQCYQTNLYYGGITNNVLKRQREHRRGRANNLKSNIKPWHLYQDKIQLIILWSFKTKKEACVYEKQWIINNYQNPLCLNCSVSNSEYSYKNHAQISKRLMSQEKHNACCLNGSGTKPKTRFALEVNSPEKTYTFKSGVEAAKFCKLKYCRVIGSCKNAKPCSSESGRWLFSDISIEDLKRKFNSLAQKQIKSNTNRGFILTNKNTGQQSQVFYSVCDPQKHGYDLHKGRLSMCLNGKKYRTVRGYYATICI